MATLCEFDENDGFFTTFCDPKMGHTFRLFKNILYTFLPKNDTKNPEVIIKLDNMLKN